MVSVCSVVSMVSLVCPCFAVLHGVHAFHGTVTLFCHGFYSFIFWFYDPCCLLQFSGCVCILFFNVFHGFYSFCGFLGLGGAYSFHAFHGFSGCYVCSSFYGFYGFHSIYGFCFFARLTRFLGFYGFSGVYAFYGFHGLYGFYGFHFCVMVCWVSFFLHSCWLFYIASYIQQVPCVVRLKAAHTMSTVQCFGLPSCDPGNSCSLRHCEGRFRSQSARTFHLWPWSLVLIVKSFLEKVATWSTTLAHFGKHAALKRHVGLCCLLLLCGTLVPSESGIISQPLLTYTRFRLAVVAFDVAKPCFCQHVERGLPTLIRLKPCSPSVCILTEVLETRW